eukprot:2127753-Pyramimonas_sp.AAC.2
MAVASSPSQSCLSCPFAPCKVGDSYCGRFPWALTVQDGKVCLSPVRALVDAGALVGQGQRMQGQVNEFLLLDGSPVAEFVASVINMCSQKYSDMFCALAKQAPLQMRFRRCVS